jgi:glycosyltransferase involved in cell wall biosynthesis
MSKVSVIIPCHNEEQYIGNCLESILQNDFNQNDLEILVVDGKSEDRTREIVSNYSEKNTNIKLLDNPEKITPVALNIGISQAAGEIVIRLDAHAQYPNKYISKLIYYLDKLKADNVGGIWITLPSDNTSKARAIVAALTTPFGVGNAYYRLGIKQIKEVDTVPFGCFRRSLFDRIGMFDKRLVRNQDDEFNARIRKYGGKIYLIPEIKIKYYARGTIKSLWKMFYQYGFYKPMVNRLIGRPITARQFVPFLFVLFCIFFIPLSFIIWWLFPVSLIIFFSYMGMNIITSVWITFQKKDYNLLVWLPFAFFIVHFSYGLGYLIGLRKVVSITRRN